MNSITYRILKPGDEAALEAFLLPRIESSMFLLGNMRQSGLVDNGRPYTGTYAAAFDGDDMVGAVAHFWNGNLIVQAPVDYLYNLWQTAVSASNRSLEGIIGPAAQVEFVLNSLNMDPGLIQVDEVENLYTLDLAELVVPEALENGRPVAMTAFNTAATEAVQVGGVFTPLADRSKGYARAAVAASLLDARNEGVQTGILFTGVTNYPAQKAYGALGFNHIGDYRILRLKRPFIPGEKHATYSLD